MVVVPFGLEAQSQSSSQPDTSAGLASRVQIKTAADGGDVSVTVSARVPGTPERFSAHLNGKNVSSRLSVRSVHYAFTFSKFLPPTVDGRQVYVTNYSGGVDVYAP